MSRVLLPLGRGFENDDDDDDHGADPDHHHAAAGDPYAGLSPRTRRKRKNRDQMRAARQREKETMDRLRATVERLEMRYERLCDQQQHDASTMATPTPTAPLHPVRAVATATTTATDQYAQAVALSSRLTEENFRLKQSLHETQKLRETLERLVGDLVEPPDEDRAFMHCEFSTTTLPGDTPPNATSPRAQATDTATVGVDPFASFRALDPGIVWGLIAESHRRLAVVQQMLSDALAARARTPPTMIVVDSPDAAHRATDEHSPHPDGSPGSFAQAPSPPSSPAMPPPPPPLSPPLPSFCGWDVRHHVRGGWLLFSFEKPFAHVTAFEAMERMWTNELTMRSYRAPGLAARQTMRVVQRLNEDTYVFQRRLERPHKGRPVLTTYLRFRLKTPEGFLLVVKSLEDGDEHADGGGVWAQRLGIWTEFLVPATGDGCRARITGTINLESPEVAHQNVAELIIGLLRWENCNIGPVFKLTGR